MSKEILTYWIRKFGVEFIKEVNPSTLLYRKDDKNIYVAVVHSVGDLLDMLIESKLGSYSNVIIAVTFELDDEYVRLARESTELWHLVEIRDGAVYLSYENQNFILT